MYNQKESQLCTIDFSKALDLVSRRKVKEILLAYGIPPKVVTLVMLLHTGTTAQLVTLEGPNEDFDVLAGVLQGDTRAPYIFVLLWTTFSETPSQKLEMKSVSQPNLEDLGDTCRVPHRPRLCRRHRGSV